MNTDAIVRSVVIGIGMVVVAFVINNLGSSYLKNTAVDTCMKQSIVQWKDAENAGYNFAPEWFEGCLIQKGLK